MRPTRQARRLSCPAICLAHLSVVLSVSLCASRRGTVAVALCLNAALLSGGSCPPKQPSTPNRGDAESHRSRNVAGGWPEGARLQQLQGLQAEGGKSGEAAADADHEEDPYVGMHPDPLGNERQSGNQTDDERAENI